MRTQPLDQRSLGRLRVQIAPGQVSRWALAAALAGIVALHAFSLLRTPQPFIDEANSASLAWGLLQTGRAFGPLQAGVFERYEGHWTFFPVLGSAIQALALGAFGLNLFAVRLVSLAFGLALLPILYVIGRRLGGPRVGLLAVLLTALSRIFFYAAHLGRTDIIVAAAGFAAIALSLGANRTTWSARTILAGLLIGLACEVHPNAILFAPPIVALFWLDDRLAALASGRLWGFLAGVAVGPALYLALHVLPYPQTYAALTQVAFGASKNPPLIEPSLWWPAIRETGLRLFLADIYRLPLVVAAILWLLRRRTRADVRLLALFGVLLLEFLALLPYKPWYYFIFLIPVADLMVAVLLDRLLQLPWRGSAWAHVRTIGVASLLAASLVTNLALVRPAPMDDFQATLRRMQAVIPPGSVLMGDSKYWWGFTDHRFYSWYEPAYYRRYESGSSLDEALRALKPTVLIIDSGMEWIVTDDPSGLQPWAQMLALPRTELDQFLRLRGRLLAAIDSSASGTVRVYQIDWD